MHQITVAMVRLPAMIREILMHELSNAPDIRVGGIYGDLNELSLVSPPVQADVFILGECDEEPGDQISDFLLHHPRSTLICITANDSSAYKLQLEPLIRSIGEFSASEISEMVREATR